MLICLAINNLANNLKCNTHIISIYEIDVEVQTSALTDLTGTDLFLYKRLNYIYKDTIICHSLRNNESAKSLSKKNDASSICEREIYEMLQIFFRENLNLRKLLLPYGMFSHPLLKNHSLTGFYEVKYNIQTKTIALKPVVLEQELRF